MNQTERLNTYVIIARCFSVALGNGASLDSAIRTAMLIARLLVTGEDDDAEVLAEYEAALQTVTEGVRKLRAEDPAYADEGKPDPVKMVLFDDRPVDA